MSGFLLKKGFAVDKYRKLRKEILKIKVTVVVPTYNREKTIKRCIDSILAQTKPPFEIIVVDDGSTDRTIEIVEKIDNNIIKIIKQNHRGAQAARNLGIINAKGDYIAFLDSDDKWLPQMLEEGTFQLSKCQEDCITYSDCLVYKNNRTKLWRLPPVGNVSYASLLKQNAPMFQSMIVNKDLFFKIGLLDENVEAFQEWDTSIRLSKEAKFIHIKKPLFAYYLHDGETISKSKNKEVNGYNYILKKFKNEIIKVHGIHAINAHYKNLIYKCFRYKSKKIIAVIFEVLYINIVFYIRKTIKINSNSYNS